jgi:ParB-like chromosome segregation protein Spo0J
MPTIAMPCLQVRLVPRARVVANTWNPNHVSPEKLALLRQSILDNGFCFPIVTIYDPEQDRYVIIDGFHRRLLCEPEGLDVPEVPVVVLAHDLSQRMAATIQFNKARGVHQVDLDAEVIRSLIEQGMVEEDIAVHLGIDLDTIYRYKQLTGIAELFKASAYSMSWAMEEDHG